MSAAEAIALSGRNILGFAFGFALIYGAVASVNAVADPYAEFFFLTHLRPPRVRTFDDRTDIRYKAALVRQAGREGVDAAIFGSSRVMAIDPQMPDFRAIAPRALNLGVQGARLGIARQFVQYVARRNPHCLAVVGLDFFAFHASPLETSIYLDDVSPFAAWYECLERLGSRQRLRESWEMLHGFPVASRFLPNGRALRARQTAAEVDALLARFIERDWERSPHFRQFHYDPTKLDALREMRRALPRVVFFTNPVTRAYLQGMKNAGLESTHRRWLADLAALGGVIDFSEAEAIVDQPRFFNDVHHYEAEAGAMILQDVAAHLRGEPLRWGRLLTAATIRE